MEIKYILLLLTDDGSASKTALRVAMKLARTHSAKLAALRFVHLADWSRKATFGNNPPQPATYFQNIQDRFHKQVHTVDPDAEVEYLLVEDDPIEALSRLTSERECDLIVLGNNGRRWLDRLLFRSLPERIVEASPCPVLLVNSE